MVIHAEIEVEITAATGAGLQVALAFQPQPGAIFHTRRNTHLHALIIHGKRALTAAEGL